VEIGCLYFLYKALSVMQFAANVERLGEEAVFKVYRFNTVSLFNKDLQLQKIVLQPLFC
jgi:hypothetical protein